jgi:hypothetical protein
LAFSLAFLTGWARFSPRTPNPKCRPRGDPSGVYNPGPGVCYCGRHESCVKSAPSFPGASRRHNRYPQLTLETPSTAARSGPGGGGLSGLNRSQPHSSPPPARGRSQSPGLTRGDQKATGLGGSSHKGYAWEVDLKTMTGGRSFQPTWRGRGQTPSATRTRKPQVNISSMQFCGAAKFVGSSGVANLGKSHPQAPGQ